MKTAVRIVLFVLLVAIVLFAVANRAPTTVSLWPLPWTVRLPLYGAVLGACAVGLVVGTLIGLAARGRLWLRARASERRAARLERDRPPPQPPASPPAARPVPPPARTRSLIDDE